MSCDFVQNPECPYFPCHEGVPKERFSCLFCYCPLYALGEECGGYFKYTPDGFKDCSGCVRPHLQDSYPMICEKLKQVLDLVKKP